MSFLSKIVCTLLPVCGLLGGLFQQFQAPMPVAHVFEFPADHRVEQLQHEVEQLHSQIDASLERSAEALPIGVGVIPDNLDQVKALFSQSLAAGIGKTDTSFTLTSASDAEGNTLSGTYGFIIHEGFSDQEIVRGDCTGTSCTNVLRGISVTTGTSTVAVLRKTHRAGDSVKITTGPILLQLRNLAYGTDFFPKVLHYSSTTAACSRSDDICKKSYIDSVAAAGAADADETTKGLSELATAAEAAAGTSLGGTGGRLVIPNSLATSTPSINPGQGFVCTTGSNGQISANCIATSSVYRWTGAHTFGYNGGATTTIAGGLEFGVAIGSTTPSQSATFAIEAQSGNVPALLIADKGTTTPVLTVFTGATSTLTNYTAFNQYTVRAHAASTLTLTGNATTTITWDGEDFDTGNMHTNSGSNSRLTVPIDGYYLISVGVYAQGQANLEFTKTTLAKNGVTTPDSVLGYQVNAPNTTTRLDTHNMTTVAHLNAGDYVEVFYFSNNTTLDFNQKQSHFDMSLLSK